MPGPNGIAAHHAAPTPPPLEMPPAPPQTAVSPEEVVAFLDGVDAPRGPGQGVQCTSHAETARQRSVESAMNTLVGQDVDALGNLVTSEPRVLGALGRMSSDRLAREIGGALDRGRTGLVDRLGGNYFLGQTAAGRVEARVESGFREMVRNETLGALDDVVHTIGRSNTAALTRELAAAEAGTEAHAMAETLGVRGAPGDEQRLRTSLRDLVRSVRDFRQHIFGGTWEPSDFPASTQRALCRLGMTEAPDGSILADAIHGDREVTDAVHSGITAIDVGHAAVELSHFIRHPGLLTGGPLLVTLAGIGIGLEIHHAVQENIEERREFAAELGL